MKTVLRIVGWSVILVMTLVFRADLPPGESVVRAVVRALVR